MALPILPLVRPSVLTGQANGLLNPTILVTTPGQAGGPDVVLVEPAARAWRAMTSAAFLEAGHILKASSLYDSYRPRSIQERIFEQRYTTTNTGIDCRVCGGVRYCKRSAAFATAACPGTSNHGWGLAVDTGVELDDDTGTESIASDKTALKWLVDNEQRFGFSHELESEPWHIRYVTGDTIPAEVLAFEASGPPTTDHFTPHSNRRKRMLPNDSFWHDGRFWAVTRGVDNALWVNSLFNNQWTGWQSLKGELTSEPVISLGPWGRIDVTARGKDNALYHIARNGDSGWTAWFKVGGTIPDPLHTG